MSDIKKPKKHKKRIIDVEKPGTSAPSATSRPVIVTNRPLLQDPMMLALGNEDSQEPEDQPGAILAAERKPVLKPSAEVDEEQVVDDAEEPTIMKPAKDQETEVDEEDSAVSQNEPVTADQSPGTGPEPSEAPTPAGLNQADGPGPTGTGDTPSPEESPADTSKQSPAKQAEAEAAAHSKHEAEVQELIESKRYALPIRTIEQRKSKRFVILGVGLAIILIIIWVDIALDAGIIKLGGLKPLTHFFSN